MAPFFFHLLPQRPILIDINPDLMNIYQVIKTDVESLIVSLKQHKNEASYYYQIRNIDRDPIQFSKWSQWKKHLATFL